MTNGQQKVNHTGQFLPFEGITIICNLETDVREFWEEYKSVIPNHKLSILPYESLHMTLHNLATLNKFNGSREQYENYKSNQPTINYDNECVIMEMKQCYHHGIYLTHIDVDELAKLNHWRHEIGTAMREKKQDVPLNVKLHMSLAYRIPHSEPLTKAEMSAIEQVITKHLPKELRFSGPHKATFDSMQHYKPCTHTPVT